MGEILKKYAHVLDSGLESLQQEEKLPEASPPSSNRFVPYAESGRRKEAEGFYSGKPDSEEIGYSSAGRHGDREQMEGETYRQTKAADVDAEKAFERMTYRHHHGEAGPEGQKRKKSVYAHD